MAPSILCNEMWGPPGATNDNLGMLSVFSNFQTYRQTGKLILASSAITDLSFLSELPNLSVLSLSDCQRLVDISGLKHCTALQHLTLTQTFVETPTQARSLASSFPREHHLWSAVAQMRQLQELHVGVQEGGGGECTWVTTVETIAQLPALRLLSLKGCAAVKSLAPVVRSRALQVVDLRGVGYSSRELWTLKDSTSLVRVLLGQEEYDEDPREDAPSELQEKLVLVSAGALGHLGDAVEMKAGFAALKSAGSWAVGNLMCY